MLFHTPLLAIALSVQAAPAPAPEATQAEAPQAEAKAEQAPIDATKPKSQAMAANTNTASGKQEAKKKRGDEIVCRREAVVGSKFKKKICATRDEWETLANRSRDTTQEFQQRGVGFEPVN